MENFLRQAIWFVPPFLLAISFHESAHAYVAYRLGDPTARDLGRVTLNPIAHIDPLGFLMLFLVHFGWAKPVPVNPYNLKNPIRDNLWISLAGPTSNLILAIFSALLFRSLLPLLIGRTDGEFFLTMLQLSVTLNLVLMVFNLFPIPPLDGFHILEGLVSTENYVKLQALNRYGPLILMVIIMFGFITRVNIFGLIFGPIVSVLGGFLLGMPVGW